MNATEQAQRLAIVTEAFTWLRTPYQQLARIKGVGVDCSMLLAEVYESAGVIEHIAPTYTADWHLHHSEEQYLGWLEQLGAYEIEAPLPGDLALFKFGRCYSHGAIVIDAPKIIHAYFGRNVELASLDETLLQDRSVKFFTLWGKH